MAATERKATWDEVVRILCQTPLEITSTCSSDAFADSTGDDDTRVVRGGCGRIRSVWNDDRGGTEYSLYRSITWTPA